MKQREATLRQFEPARRQVDATPKQFEAALKQFVPLETNLFFFLSYLILGATL